MCTEEGKLIPWSPKEIMEVADKAEVKVDHEYVYDFLYVCNMAKADYFEDSLKTAEDCIKWAEDYLDDPDGYEGKPFCRWMTDMWNLDIEIDWDDFIDEHTCEDEDKDND